jgi:hypothetical protein
MSAVDVLAVGSYWLTKFSTVSGVRSGTVNRIQVQLLGAVPGSCGRIYRVMLPHRVIGIAERAALARVGGAA